MTLVTDADIVKIGEVPARTAVEDGIAMQRQGSVGADGETRGGGPLHRVVELKLVVGDDFAGTIVLVREDTVLEADNGVGVADGLTLGGDGLGDVVRGDFKGAGVVFIAATRGLS